VIFALPSVLQSLIPQSSSGGVPIDDITSIAYGVLIIVFFVLEPRGVVGLGRRVASLWSRVAVRAGEGGALPEEIQPLERREATWAR
jgi:hypothetical protein